MMKPLSRSADPSRLRVTHTQRKGQYGYNGRAGDTADGSDQVPNRYAMTGAVKASSTTPAVPNFASGNGLAFAEVDRRIVRWVGPLSRVRSPKGFTCSQPLNDGAPLDLDRRKNGDEWIAFVFRRLGLTTSDVAMRWQVVGAPTACGPTADIQRQPSQRLPTR